MPEETQPGGTQAEPTQQPQAGTPPTTAPQAGTDTTHTTDTPTAEDFARLKKELEATRREAAGHRTKLKSFEDAQAAADAAKLSDLERATKQAEEHAKAAETFKRALAAAKLENAAIKSNAIDADAVVALLSGKLDFADDGQPTNVDELVKALAKDKPHLFKPATEPTKPPVSSGGASNPGRGAQVPPQRQPGQLARFGTGQPLFKR